MNKKTASLPAVTFDHLTFNTGDNFRNLKFSPFPHAVDLLRPLALPGSHDLSRLFFPDSTLLMTFRAAHHRVFTVYHCGFPALTCHACLDQGANDSVWLAALAAHRSLPPDEVIQACPKEVLDFCFSTPPLTKPPGMFLTVHLHPGLALLPQEQLGMVADFERCLYWALWATNPWSERNAERRLSA